MRAGKKVIYWDTSVFLAWLQDEPWDAEIIDGIEATVRHVHNNQILLITSIVTDTEVLRSRMTPEALRKWEGVFKRKNVKMIVHDQRVGRKSNEIRDCFFQRKIKIATPDSIHLATAIINEADEFHTLDGAGPTKKASDLIRLNGDPCVNGLKIITPAATTKQMSLLRGVTPEKKDDGKQERPGRRFADTDEEV
jgi:hypothetical protein